MKVIIAPDKFKGSLSAMEVCKAINRGLKNWDPAIETILHPLADGGEGTLAILQNYFELAKIEVVVKNPLFKDITASYLVSKDTAFIEMSHASGLQLLQIEERDCMHTTTIGTGQLIADAIKKGYKKIVLFIGGSATNDGGIGMAAALGYDFFDSKGAVLSPVGASLIAIDSIDSSNRKLELNDIEFTVVCDVKNPLYGPNGAAYIYGAQKGASAESIALLDMGLQNFSKQVEIHLKIDVATILGGGAAGGLGAGAVCFLNAKIKSGIDFIMDQTNFDVAITGKDTLIITGEGSLDKQTVEGKVIKGISDRAHKNKIPFVIIAGIIKDQELIKEKLQPHSMHAIMDVAVSTTDAMSNAAKHIEFIAYQLIKDYFKN
ncbi:MAG: glycerate kinase [Flavobacterium sp.]|nr:glycerate kinase [Flavobacterium sp.]